MFFAEFPEDSARFAALIVLGKKKEWDVCMQTWCDMTKEGRAFEIEYLVYKQTRAKLVEMASTNLDDMETSYRRELANFEQITKYLNIANESPDRIALDVEVLGYSTGNKTYTELSYMLDTCARYVNNNRDAINRCKPLVPKAQEDLIKFDAENKEPQPKRDDSTFYFQRYEAEREYYGALHSFETTISKFTNNVALIKKLRDLDRRNVQAYLHEAKSGLHDAGHIALVKGINQALYIFTYEERRSIEQQWKW